ncbi:arginine--tRNA ligase [Patescibacteria group bacterium]|nr:arginine--tRNA ligase [Patescibacteria group bacterium]
MNAKDSILRILRRIVPDAKEGDVVVPDGQAAHYSTTIAFRLAKEQGKSPAAVAAVLVRDIKERAPRGFFEKVEAAGPGFVNFYLTPSALNAGLMGILKLGRRYGASKAAAGSKVQVEFVSANPTGPLTLANGRGGFLGDVLGNVLRLAGAKVEKEYYVNDTGHQVLTLGQSIIAALGIIPDEESFYKGEYVKDWAKKNAALVKRLQKDPMALGERAAKDFLGLIKKAVGEKAGIRFDRYTSEKAVHKAKMPQKAMEIFKKAGFIYESEGAVWLKTTAFGDDKDRVLVTSDGNPTYFLSDAGHYLETQKRGFSEKINILGPDHYGYVKRIQSVAKILGFKRSEVIITQAIRLMKDGTEFKMSKRKGNFLTFEDLVDEVGLDVARFFFLMISPSTHMDFDMGLAKERSVKNPIYYVQYAYVRAKGILKKAGAVRPDSKDLGLLDTPEDQVLIRALLEFPDLIEETARDYQAHRLARYAIDLARDFQQFYEKERIIGEAGDVKGARLALVRATATVLENLFVVLGISAPKKM